MLENFYYNELLVDEVGGLKISYAEISAAENTTFHLYTVKTVTVVEENDNEFTTLYRKCGEEWKPIGYMYLNDDSTRWRVSISGLSVPGMEISVYMTPADFWQMMIHFI